MQWPTAAASHSHLWKYISSLTALPQDTLPPLVKCNVILTQQNSWLVLYGAMKYFPGDVD